MQQGHFTRSTHGQLASYAAICRLPLSQAQAAGQGGATAGGPRACRGWSNMFTLWHAYA